jgi:hypothetical protein
MEHTHFAVMPEMEEGYSIDIPQELFLSVS